jgi:aminoglycoside/choline kinase family phosphotransferase
MTDSSTSITQRKRSDALPPPPKSALCHALQIDEIQVEWLAGDGSDRCYYRLRSSQLKRPLVLMQLSESDAHALRSGGYDWLKVAAVFDGVGIPHPRPVATLPDYTALIIEDYGDVMLESIILAQSDENTIVGWYERCFDILARMLKITGDASVVWKTRAFDAAKYEWELQFFKRQYLDLVCERKLSAAEERSFNHDVTALARFLSQQSNFFCHRDFHSRNIMVHANELALIDFQDARLGSPVYDLVSLVFDNYVPLSAEFRLVLLEKGVDAISAEQWRSHLGAIILQRQIKAIGTYGFLTKTKLRGDYLIYVKPALASLPRALVFDKRWPFLSRDLLDLISI